MNTTQQGKTREFDVIIIGSGLAGLHYCMQLLMLKPNLNIAILSKAELGECNSRYAQGGIAAVFNSDDSFLAHRTDTLKAGDGLCYEPAVDTIVQQGPIAIEQLQAYSIPFNQHADGTYDLAKEGGHQHRRIVHCGDSTGLSIIDALLTSAKNNPRIHFLEHHIAVNLITQYYPHRTDHQGEVLGAYVLDCQHNQIHTYLSRCVVLATGGAGKHIDIPQTL